MRAVWESKNIRIAIPAMKTASFNLLTCFQQWPLAPNLRKTAGKT